MRRSVTMTSKGLEASSSKASLTTELTTVQTWPGRRSGVGHHVGVVGFVFDDQDLGGQNGVTGVSGVRRVGSPVDRHGGDSSAVRRR